MNKDSIIYFLILSSIVIICSACKKSVDPIISNSLYITFETTRNGPGGDIYRMDISGNDQTNLTNDIDNYQGVRRHDVSPDGSKIVFEYDEYPSYIYIMDISGKNKFRLCRGRYPTFSPDGSQIAFSSNNDIHIMNIDGSDLLNLSNSPDTSYGGILCFSPDGKYITCTVSDPSPLHHNHICILSIDGTTKTKLTSGNESIHSPKFSPDGSKIAFFSTEAIYSKIYTIHTDGTSRKLLGEGRYPIFSPDGSIILYKLPKDGEDEIYIMDIDGNNKELLVNGFFATFSPDGSIIAYMFFSNHGYDIFVMNIDGSNKQNLTNSPGGDYNPIFYTISN